jgi:cysteine-rich repeat protein
MWRDLLGSLALAATVTSCNEIANIRAPATPCGNGVVDDGEECDDGNLTPEDGCDLDCRREPVLQIATGEHHACALLHGGRVKCWGDNADGQLGLGDTAGRGDEPGEMGGALSAVDLGTGKTAIALTAGGTHTCALLAEGTIKCWGYNFSGQLGLGDQENRGDEPGDMGDALPIAELGTGRTAVALEASYGSTCAVLDNGTVKCWGFNASGQLGLGDELPRGSGEKAVAITAGVGHKCALLEDDSVRCWGSNSSGQLGLGDMANRGDAPGEMGDALPQVGQAVGLGVAKRATTLALGGAFTCARLDNSTMKCWGFNYDGALGLSDQENRGDAPGEMGDELPPVDLGASKPVRSPAARSTHACALLEDGTVRCWGFNSSGGLGLGDTQPRGWKSGQMGDALPAVELGSKAAAVVAGVECTCAVLEDGRAKCWGDNSGGKLGLGDTATRGDQPGEMGDALPFVRLYGDEW